MKKVELIIAISVSVLMTSFNRASAQEIRLGMTRDDFVRTFGQPDEEKTLDTVDTGPIQMLFYGDNFFEFRYEYLTQMDIITGGFSLTFISTDAIAVGDSFQNISWYPYLVPELISSDGGHNRYRCKKDDYNVFISVDNGIVTGFKVEHDDSDINFMKREFIAFFESAYNPTSDIQENSLWPGRIRVKWKEASYLFSMDKKALTCCVPFVPELNTAALYGDEACPEMARMLVITKIIDGSRFKLNIVSVVPKSGLSVGSEFTGMVFYNNVNTGAGSAWEYYEGGKLVCSKYPVSKSGNSALGVNLYYRMVQRISYSGGESVISDKDWMLLSANRLDTTLVLTRNLSSGRDADKVMAEKSRYTFSSVTNPDFSLEEELKEEQKEENQDVRTEEQEETPDKPETIQEQKTAEGSDEPLPNYLGKADNLSGIIWSRQSLIKLGYERREDMSNPNKSKNVLVCTNPDYCPYTLFFDNGMIVRTGHGTHDLDDRQLSDSYRHYRGDLLSNIDFKFPYALPVASGTKVKLIPDTRERYRSFAVIMPTGEPVYAMRGGVICMTDDNRSVLVCHKDGTFAAYMNVDDVCVAPGDYVHPGESIGVCGGGKLSISIFYLDNNKIKGESSNRYTHITPYIRTESGDVKLETNVEYVSLIDDDIITKEMGALEKRKYLKKK